jgi:HEAT repeat protein
LAAQPTAALDLLERELAPLPGDLDAHVRALVAQLHHARFAVRERAQQQLAAFGTLAEPELRRQIDRGLPLEARTRVTQLLNSMPGPFAATTADRRLVRIVAVLDRIDDPRARALLAALAPARAWAIVDGRVPPLYAQLASSQPAVRASAAVALLRLGDAATPALPRLIDLLGDVGPLVPVGANARSVADHVTAGFPLMGRRAVDALLGALERPSAEIRKRAALLLGVVRDDRAIEPLVAQLADADSAVASQASQSLGRFGAKAFAPLLKSLDHEDPTVRGLVAASLGETRDARAIEPIARLLRDGDATVRQWAIQSLRPFKAAAIDEMVAALRSDEAPICDDARLRLQIVNELVLIDDPRVYEPLVAALRDPQPEIRGLALSFLLLRRREAFDDPQLAAMVIEGLVDPAPNVRIAAANVLGQVAQRAMPLDPKRVAAALIAALDDENDNVRAAAAEAIGRWRFEEAAEALLRRLDDNAVRVVAAEALGRIGDQRAIEPLRRFLPGQDPRVINALGDLRDRESVPALIALVAGGTPQAQQAAAQALGKIRDRRAVEPLIAALQGQGPQPQTIARALGEIGDPRAVTPLIELSRRADGSLNRLVFAEQVPPERHPAAWPLVNLGPTAVPGLAEALSDDAVSAREVAAWALYNISVQGAADAVDMQPAVESLVAALADTSNVVRYHAAMALGALDDRRAAPVLLEMISANVAAENPSFMYGNAASHLAGLKDAAVAPALLSLLSDNRPTVRASVARVLGGLRDERNIPPLVTLLDDDAPEIRVEAARSLGLLKAAVAVDGLAALLQSDAPDLRAAAAQSLGRIGEPRVADALVALADDASLDVRMAAGLALVQLDDARGVPLVTNGLTDGNSERREQAALAVQLSSVASELLIPPLVDALTDTAVNTRLNAMRALGHIGGDRAVAALLAEVDGEENIDVVLLALGATHDARAFPALVAHLEDKRPYVRATAVGEITKSEIPNRVELLVARLGDSDPGVRIAAIDGLLRLNAASALPQLTAAASDADPGVAARAARAVSRLSRTAS